jgi:cyclopropane fatty-acyl-phospholipid synthase-like methyltransferase
MAGHFGGNPYAKWGRDANAPHVSRYFLARGWVMPGETVLDAACCTGYGSHLLAQVAGKVIGYEVDEGCISDANGRWGEEKIDFQVKDLDTCELPDVDVAVTIETVEHLNDMNHFLDQLTKHVKRLVIITVPLGGTSYAYVNEVPSPATEKNDFGNGDAVDAHFFKRGWEKMTDFKFGYSYFGVYYKTDLYDEKK